MARDERVGKPAYAAVSTRVTGIEVAHARLREIAVVRIDERGAVVDEWSAVLHPDGAWIALADVASTLRERLSQMAIVTHNGRLGIEVLRAELAHLGWQLPTFAQMTTLDASYHYLPGLAHRRLSDCCTAAGVPFEGGGPPHTSPVNEARATAGLLSRFVQSVGGVPDLPELLQVTLRAWVYPWPAGPSRMAEAPRPWPGRRGPGILTTLGGQPLADAISAVADVHTHGYLTLVAETLQDGRLTPETAPGLADAEPLYRLTPEAASGIRRKFFDALVHQAIAADRYHLEARQELWRVADTLGCPRDAVIEPIVEATPVEFPKLVEESGAKKPTDGRSVATPAQMRAWAIANGFDVEGYIRLPWSIVRAFEEAHAEPVDRTTHDLSVPDQPLRDDLRDEPPHDPPAREARHAAAELRPVLRPTRTDRGTDPDEGIPQLEFDRLETPPIGNPVV
ncbi:3'-5' exonuclease [Promicromonospora soli]